MANRFHHETIYRGKEVLDRLANVRVTVCGAGALGSNLAENLIRQNFQKLQVIDFDRVEEQNINTQIYAEADIGAIKVDVLRNRLFRIAGVEIDTSNKRLTASNATKLLADSDLVLDMFDNSESRQHVQDACRAQAIPCLHAGLSADYGEVIWDEHYRVPSDAGQDVCDYPLARNLVLMTAAVATELIIRFIIDRNMQSFAITLNDFGITPLEPQEAVTQ